MTEYLSMLLCEVTKEKSEKALEFISAEIHNNIENPECELFYAFRTLSHQSKRRIGGMLSIESIQLYEHLRNDIISKGAEFRNRNVGPPAPQTCARSRETPV